MKIFCLFVFLSSVLAEGPSIPDTLTVLPNDALGLTQYLRTLDQMPVIFVPAGDYFIGSEDPLHYEFEKPMLGVKLNAFLIDKYEISASMYASCVQVGHCKPAANEASGDLPMTGITWEMARKYCQWGKMDLPTEAQWEVAARGKASTSYPWGNNLADKSGKSLMQTATEGPYPITSQPLDFKTDFGLLNMAGNVSEWVKDGVVVAKNGEPGPRPLDVEQKKSRRVLHYEALIESDVRIYKGSSYKTAYPAHQRPSMRYALKADSSLEHLGFRCAREVRP